MISIIIENEHELEGIEHSHGFWFINEEEKKDSSKGTRVFCLENGKMYRYVVGSGWHYDITIDFNLIKNIERTVGRCYEETSIFERPSAKNSIKMMDFIHNIIGK